jgi:3-hydroxy-9,10-secoandrosta-1,3,5(10)-triene-9,17-dione monooxygenase reductase component
VPQSEVFDAPRFRKVLGRFTTGVTIITTRDPAGYPVGVTANSFNAVSLQPPLVLFSLARTAQSLSSFEQAAHWAVHILSAGQEALSNRFARSGADKFSGIEVESGHGGVPLLSGCTARLQCKNALQYAGGDHVIFVGEVLAFDDQEIIPLVYQSGQYGVASRKLGISLDNPGARRLDIGFDQDFIGYLLARAHFQFFGRMSEMMVRRDLGDVHLYILFGLSVKETRSVAELDRLMRPARQEITPAALETLYTRGLIEVTGDGPSAIFRLTPAGHRIALDCMAECKDIESTVLDRLGVWNAAAFKDLLKQFIQETDTGVPHPWEAGDADPGQQALG